MKGKGRQRVSPGGIPSVGEPGSFAQPDLVNAQVNPQPGEQYVDTRDKLAYNR